MKSSRFVLAASLLALLSSFPTSSRAADATTTAPAAAKRYGTWGVDLDAMDKSVKPGDDFFRYVNGKWASTAQIPADRTSYGSFAMLRNPSTLRLHEILERFAADMLRPAGWPEPEKNAADVVAMETKIAEAHWSRAEGRDRDKTYNPTTLAELEKNAPGFPWTVYFKEAGIDKADRAVVRQNT